jgi:hypothetical protein
MGIVNEFRKYEINTKKLEKDKIKTIKSNLSELELPFYTNPNELVFATPPKYDYKELEEKIFSQLKEEDYIYKTSQDMLAGTDFSFLIDLSGGYHDYNKDCKMSGKKDIVRYNLAIFFSREKEMAELITEAIELSKMDDKYFIEMCKNFNDMIDEAMRNKKAMMSGKKDE